MTRLRKFSGLAAIVCLAGCASPRPLDETQGQSQICEVHHVQMIKVSVPIHYGLPAYGEREAARRAASTNSFPHARDWVGGGCVVTRHSPRDAIVFVCAECQRGWREWEAAYDSKH